MNTVWQLILRNSKLFIRNRSTVFFSFLSMFIIIGIYVIFMGEVQVEELAKQFGDKEAAKWLINSWIMGGIITVNAVNITMNALSIMVEDKERGYLKDFLVAPIKRWQIILGYLGASILVGTIMTMISFIGAEIFIVLNGGSLLPLLSIVKVTIGIIISIIAIASIFLFLFLFVKSEKTSSTVSTLVGTLIGFIAGVYVPIGVMPVIAQQFIKMLPFTYSATYFKQIFISEPSKVLFEGVDKYISNDWNTIMGNIITIKGFEITLNAMLLVLVITSIIFFTASVIKLKNTKNR